MIFEENLEKKLEENLSQYNNGKKTKLLTITLIVQTQELNRKLTEAWNKETSQ